MNRSRSDQRDYTLQLRAAMRRYLPWRGLPLLGAGRWTDRLLVMVMLLMVFASSPTLQDRLAEARTAVVTMYVSRRRPGTSYGGFIKKLRKHSARLLDLVIQTLRQRLRASAGGHWKVGRFLAFGVDGSKSDAPRTRANQQTLKIGGKRKSGPQQLLVTLMHVGTGLPWSWRRGEATASERSLFLQQLGTLPGAVLLLMDAGFTGYDLLAQLLACGHQVLVRAGANVTLLRKLGWVLEEHGDLVYLWPEMAQRHKGQPLVLRRIVVVDGRNRRMCLLTNLLEKDLSVAEAVELYQRRWGIEVLYRGLKQTLGRRKMLSDNPLNAGWNWTGPWPATGCWACSSGNGGGKRWRWAAAWPRPCGWSARPWPGMATSVRASRRPGKVSPWIGTGGGGPRQRGTGRTKRTSRRAGLPKCAWPHGGKYNGHSDLHAYELPLSSRRWVPCRHRAVRGVGMPAGLSFRYCILSP